MKQVIKKVIKSISPKLFFVLKIFNDLKYKDSYFTSTGYFASVVEEKPVDQFGNEIPWMNYNIVKVLQERLKKKYVVI